MTGNERVLAGARTVRVRAAGPRDWTQAKRAAFLDELAATCNVTASAEAAGVSPSAAYSLRARSAEFRAGWALALREGYAKLELMLLERAMNGTVKVHERPDGAVDKTTEYPNAIALQLLKMHRDSVAAEEAIHEDEELDAVRARIGRKLAAVRRRLELGCSAAALAAAGGGAAGGDKARADPGRGAAQSGAGGSGGAEGSGGADGSGAGQGGAEDGGGAAPAAGGANR